MSDLLYLYGFVNYPNGGSSLLTTGRVDETWQEGLFTIPYTDIACLARHVPEEQFGEGVLEERIKDLEWLKAQLWEHERTLERVMKAGTVIPLKWGTLFRTEEAVRGTLKDRYEAIRELLGTLDNREEWTVRVHVDRGRLHEGLKALDPEIQRLTVAIETLPSGTAYLLAERLKRLTEEVGQRTVDAVIQGLVTEMMQHAEASATAEPVRGEHHSSRPELVFQMAFLIHRKKLQAFSHVVQQAATQRAPQGVEIHQVGPFPPYYFCDLELKGCVEHG